MHQHPLGLALDDSLAQDATRFESRTRSGGLHPSDALSVADPLVRCGIQRAAVDSVAKSWGYGGRDRDVGNNLAMGTDGSQFIRIDGMIDSRGRGVSRTE